MFTTHVSDEPLEIIRANECVDDGSLAGKRFRRLWNEVEALRSLLSAYVADETRFNRGEGEPYGSITTETGMRARAATSQ